MLLIDLVGQKPFKRSLRGSDAISETSSVSHIEDLEKMEQPSGGQEASEANSMSDAQGRLPLRKPSCLELSRTGPRACKMTARR